MSARCAVLHRRADLAASGGRRGVDLRARGPCFALPVKARRAKARERLPSYREPASRDPQVTREEIFRSPHACAPFRLLPIRAPRQAVLRTSSRLAPSWTTNRPCDLPVKKTRDASNRRLPPNRTACTRTSSVPGSSCHFRSGDAPRSLRLRAVDRGTGRFTTSETASAGRHSNAVSSCSLPHGWSHERGRFLPTALDATEPLTPLSRSTVHPRASLTFARAATWPYVLPRKGLYGSEDAADHQDHRGRRLVKSDAS